MLERFSRSFNELSDSEPADSLRIWSGMLPAVDHAKPSFYMESHLSRVSLVKEDFCTQANQLQWPIRSCFQNGWSLDSGSSESIITHCSSQFFIYMAVKGQQARRRDTRFVILGLRQCASQIATQNTYSCCVHRIFLLDCFSALVWYFLQVKCWWSHQEWKTHGGILDRFWKSKQNSQIFMSWVIDKRVFETFCKCVNWAWVENDVVKSSMQVAYFL